MEDLDPVADLAPPAPKSQESWSIYSVIDTFLRGPPEDSIYVVATADPVPTEERVATVAHPHLIRRFEETGCVKWKLGRRVVEVKAGAGQMSEYLGVVRELFDYKSLAISRERPLFSDGHSLSRATQVAWVAFDLKNLVILSMALKEIGLRFAAQPGIDWRNGWCDSPTRLRAVLGIVAIIIDVALLIDHAGAVWLRPAVLDVLLRLSLIGADLTQPVPQPGSSRSISLPASYLSQLAHATANEGSLLRAQVLRRAHLHASSRMPGPACHHPALCSPLRAAFIARISENPDLLGLEPMEVSVRLSSG
ncbi:hypothetical protein FB107DRAFT_247894, partial [Schizophyllum commune]